MVSSSSGLGLSTVFICPKKVLKLLFTVFTVESGDSSCSLSLINLTLLVDEVTYIESFLYCSPSCGYHITSLIFDSITKLSKVFLDKFQHFSALKLTQIKYKPKRASAPNLVFSRVQPGIKPPARVVSCRIGRPVEITQI